MTNESLLDKDWDAAVARFGGAEHLENEARALGVFRRVRALKCASDLLRLTLAYCLGSMGLRLTAAWAEAIGLASLSNVALLKRLRSMVPWLEILVARLLAAPAGTAICTQTDNRLIRLVDATTVAKSGRDARSAGGVWRVHAVFDLPSERFSAFELTDETEGERLDRAAVVPGEIRIADRAYLQPERLAKVLEAGADVIIRAPWNGARWIDEKGDRVDLIAMLSGTHAKRILPIGRFGSRRRSRRGLRCGWWRCASPKKRSLHRSKEPNAQAKIKARPCGRKRSWLPNG